MIEKPKIEETVSKTPWSIEQDDVSGEFAIFDADRRLVADNIAYEHDAEAIVKAINGGNGGNNVAKEEKYED